MMEDEATVNDADLPAPSGSESLGAASAYKLESDESRASSLHTVTNDEAGPLSINRPPQLQTGVSDVTPVQPRRASRFSMFEGLAVSRETPKSPKTARREWEHKLSIQCRACGGRMCKRCGVEAGLAYGLGPIRGLHCNWVSADNSLLGMMRPSTKLIKEHGIIDQFKSLNIGAIFNLTVPGEHPHCGEPLEASGFPYLPEDFMNQGIAFYNFGWTDMTVPTLQYALDVVKVVASHIEGRKERVSIHCHAGFGRTGLIAACSQVYILKLHPQQAIDEVRRRRPRSIQTKLQQQFVYEFCEFLGNREMVFARSHQSQFTLDQCLEKQRLWMHGQEAVWYKHTPKVLALLTKRMLRDIAKSPDIVANSIASYRIFSRFGEPAPQKDTENVFEEQLAEEVKSALNCGDWMCLSADRDDLLPVNIVAKLFLDWMYHLAQPLLEVVWFLRLSPSHTTHTDLRLHNLDPKTVASQSLAAKGHGRSQSVAVFHAPSDVEPAVQSHTLVARKSVNLLITSPIDVASSPESSLEKMEKSGTMKVVSLFLRTLKNECCTSDIYHGSCVKIIMALVHERVSLSDSVIKSIEKWLLGLKEGRIPTILAELDSQFGISDCVDQEKRKESTEADNQSTAQGTNQLQSRSDSASLGETGQGGISSSAQGASFVSADEESPKSHLRLPPVNGGAQVFSSSAKTSSSESLPQQNRMTQIPSPGKSPRSKIQDVTPEVKTSSPRRDITKSSDKGVFHMNNSLEGESSSLTQSSSRSPAKAAATPNPSSPLDQRGQHGLQDTEVAPREEIQNPALTQGSLQITQSNIASKDYLSSDMSKSLPSGGDPLPSTESTLPPIRK